MQFQLLALAVLAELAQGVIVQGYQGLQCTGGETFGFKIKKTSKCVDFGSHVEEQSGSILIAKPFKKHQQVFLYSDHHCKHQVFASTSEVCFPNAENVKSFKVYHG